MTGVQTCALPIWVTGISPTRVYIFSILLAKIVDDNPESGISISAFDTFGRQLFASEQILKRDKAGVAYSQVLNYLPNSSGQLTANPINTRMVVRGLTSINWWNKCSPRIS